MCSHPNKYCNFIRHNIRQNSVTMSSQIALYIKPSIDHEIKFLWLSNAIHEQMELLRIVRCNDRNM